jgi:hypothetical protein
MGQRAFLDLPAVFPLSDTANGPSSRHLTVVGLRPSPGTQLLHRQLVPPRFRFLGALLVGPDPRFAMDSDATLSGRVSPPRRLIQSGHSAVVGCPPYCSRSPP